MTILYYTLLTLLMTVAILLILLILIQKGRGGGLSSAFGGGGGGSSAFGAKTGDVLTLVTSIMFGIFISLAVALDLVVGSQYKTVLPPTTPPANSSVPVIPAPASADNTTPPTPSAPVELPAVPTTNPVAAIKQIIQNAATQPVGKP